MDVEAVKNRRRHPSLPSWLTRRRNKVQDSSQERTPQAPTKEGDKVQPISIQATFHGESSHQNGVVIEATPSTDNKAAQSISLTGGNVTNIEPSVTEIVTRNAVVLKTNVSQQSSSQHEICKNSETGEELCNHDGTDKSSPAAVQEHRVCQESPRIKQTLASVSNSTPLPSVEGIETGKIVAVPIMPIASCEMSTGEHLPNTNGVLDASGMVDKTVNSLPLNSSNPNLEHSPKANSLKVVSPAGDISTPSASNIIPNADDIYGSVCVYNPKSKKTRERGRRNIEAKTAKRASYIIGVFTLCWFPLFFESFVNIFMYISIEVEALILSIAILSAALNPIAYTVVNQQFRKEFLSNVRVITTLPRFCRTNDNS
ncbi:uncharacterized protein [Amphiura filiformis]|uniref:uncharacterized protein n=1 Tax=Amphiura filiformis TaxID=82378 RepID=UPI003B21D44B